MIRQIAFILLVITAFANESCKVIYASDTELSYNRISDEVVEGDQATDAMIAPYREKLKASMEEVIGILEVDLIKERPESNMGNWFADIFYEEANELVDGGIDFAILNQGGLRVTSMSQGPILVGEIFEVIPFDNIVSVLEADGEELLSFFHHIAKGKGWPLSHQVSMKIKDRKATDVLISGKEIQLDKTYTFAVPDYIAGGGSGSKMLKALKRTDYDVLIRELTIIHLREEYQNDISQAPAKEGRIINLDNE